MIGKHATTISTRGDVTTVTYHNTEVVQFSDKFFRLNTDGYFTVTTKRRMNEVSETFNLGFHVYQKRGVWFVDYNGVTYPFTDNGLWINR